MPFVVPVLCGTLVRVSSGEKMRFLGTDGAGKLGLQPQNTVHQLKRILGKKFQDPQVGSEERECCPENGPWMRCLPYTQLRQCA